MTMSTCSLSLFLSVVLQFGVLCCLILTIYTMEARHLLSRDDILAHRQQATCRPTLTRNVRDLVLQLCLRCRGCQAGESYRRRLPGKVPLTASPASTDARGIPVVISCDRRNRNVNNRREARTSALQPVRCSCSRNDSNSSTRYQSALNNQLTDRPCVLTAVRRVQHQQPGTTHQHDRPQAPTLYVPNAAALSKPNAVIHLETDLKSTGASMRQSQ